ncbi:MAG: peptidoglycan DD-metalloendopeptidase family protein [Methylocystis sp.]
MLKEHQFISSRVASRLMAAVGLAALMAGCADSSRLSDPFSDPFTGLKKSVASRSVDQSPTGTIQQDLPSRSASSSPVETRPLAAPQQAAFSSSSQLVSAPTPQAPQSVNSISGDPHWTANGGTPIVVSQGDTAAVIANRYGVPTDALLKSNGFTSAAQMQPGARIVIPVYRATAVASNKPTQEPVSKPLTKAEKIAIHQNELKLDRERKALEQQSSKQNNADKLVSRREELKIEKDRKANEAQDKALKQADAKSQLEKSKSSQLANLKTGQENLAPAQSDKTSQKQSASDKVLATAEAGKNVDKAPTASIPPDESKSATTDYCRPEFRCPARGRIIQGFSSGGNDGINIAVPEGTQVKAAEGGEVAYAGSELKGYGNMVLIRHPNGFVTAYAHNGELDVKKGDKVKRGQTIARSGQSGNVGSPQLHFELRKGSTPVDPTNFLAGL